MLTRVWLVRHGRTAWNAAGRMQGRADVDLDAAGQRELGSLRPPAWLTRLPCHASPLRRAVATARALGLREPRLEPRLVEMHWGEWEGATLAALRVRSGDAMAANEARGLDFRPPGGESPREVAARARAWLDELAGRHEALVAVSHKGVIRALMASAHGWDMRGRAPVRLDWACLHGFAVADDGELRLDRPNVSMRDTPWR